MEYIVKFIESFDFPIEPIVIATNKEPGKRLSDKVSEGIISSDIFIPILTRNSINNQWVNQEIGFAVAQEKRIVPVTEKQIISQLKGFIHSQIDLSCSYYGDSTNQRKESISFKNCLEILLECVLENNPQEFFTSIIKPYKVKQGNKYTTTVYFNGRLENGFFDNEVIHLETEKQRWNWDSKTLKNSKPTTAGKLHGKGFRKGEYTWDTKGWALGHYKIYTRAYDHPVQGEIGRNIVGQNEHDLYIIENKEIVKNKEKIKGIKIFLASSGELEKERKDIDTFINKQNKKLYKRGIFLHLIMWEDKSKVFYNGRYQDYLNTEIPECDVFLSLFSTKVGKFTKEEFKLAYKGFNNNEKPYSFSAFFEKLETDDTPQIINLKNYIKNQHQYYSEYDNISELISLIRDELEEIISAKN
jgi:TIR domain-containing protein